MKISTTQEHLQAGVKALYKVVARRTTLPVLSSILLESTKKGCRLTATDLDTVVSIPLPADSQEEGAVALSAVKLAGLAKALPAAQVDIEQNGKENQTAIRCGRSVTTLVGWEASEFPTMPAIDFDSAHRVVAADLQRMIDHVAFAASTEDSRPILNGVFWHWRKNRMTMVATNGHRLAKMDMPTTGEAAHDFIIHPRALKQVFRLFHPEDEIEVACTGAQVGFRANGTFVASRLIEGPYPNYQQIIPEHHTKDAVVDREALTRALRRVSVVASYTCPRVVLRFAKNQLTLEAKTPDVGRSQDELVVQYDHKPFDIGLNAEYLIELLKHMPTDEVRISMEAPEQAIVIQPEGWDDAAAYLQLLMPLRAELLD